jgi:lipid A 3-O-deacylase
MSRKLGWWFSVFVALTGAHARGAEPTQADDFSSYFFQRGKQEVMLSGGMLFSPVGADKNRPTLNYTLSGLQWGWMLTDPKSSGWLRGNFEAAGEVMGGAVVKGRGSYMVGGTLWLRYNFLQPNWRVVPFFQAGAGAEATDMDPRLIGETFNFNLNVGAGVRCFIAKDWAVSAECRYQHISNAKLSNHDIGINAVGPMVGVSYFF